MRRRYQGGHLILEGKRIQLYKCRYFDDVVLGDGTVERVHKKHTLGDTKEFPTKRLAMRAMATFVAQINSENYRPKHLITFTEFSEKWKILTMPNHKASSQVFESSIIKMLNKDFVNVALTDLDTEFLQRWLSTKKDYAPKTIRNIISVLRMMWKSAKTWGYVEGSPFEGLVLPKKGLAIKPMFLPEQARDIIRRASEPYKTMFRIVAETGMRGGEVCGLRVEDIDLKAGMISVRQSAWLGTIQTPKTANAVRQFPISPNLASHLAKASVMPIAGLMFTEGEKAMNNYAVVQNILRPILVGMKIYQPRMGLHSFRRGSCSAMDSLGTPASVRMQRVGHADFATTMGYTQPFSEDHKTAAEQLGKMFDPDVQGTEVFAEREHGNSQFMNSEYAMGAD